MPQLEQLVRGMASDHGFASIDHEVEFIGVCKACATTLPRPPQSP